MNNKKKGKLNVTLFSNSSTSLPLPARDIINECLTSHRLILVLCTEKDTLSTSFFLKRDMKFHKNSKKVSEKEEQKLQRDGSFETRDLLSLPLILYKIKGRHSQNRVTL